MTPEDAALAESLGWQAGVPTALVRLLRNGESTWKESVTDGGGVAEFENVLPGLYRLYASRTLSPGEAQGIGEPVRAFGDGQTIQMAGGGSVTRELSLLADRPSGLVISEISRWIPPVEETGGDSYLEAKYFEVYNNSAGTLFLDGKVFAVSFWTGETRPTPCVMTESARTDPAGVYVRKALQFPGDGSDYPIQPGEVKVIPVAAIDHTPVHPDLFDLSGADFEIRSVAAADNPAVPDMLDWGLEPFVTPFAGFSLTPLGGERVYVLADPVDLRSLPILLRDGNGRGYVRIPAELIVDAVTEASIWPESDREFPPCVPTVHPDFDRYEGGFIDITLNPRLTYQRRILRQEGSPVLQKTNTTAVDFIQEAPSPGVLPPP